MVAGVSPAGSSAQDAHPDASSASLHTSAAAATPLVNAQLTQQIESVKPSVLPIVLPPTALRPFAFRIFTKKHGLNVTSSALEILAAFVGRNCGSGWRDEGLAEKVLDSAARQWRKNGGGVLVEGEGSELQIILHQMESPVRLDKAPELAKKDSISSLNDIYNSSYDHQAYSNVGYATTKTSGKCASESDGLPDNVDTKDPQCWLRIINAFDQPKLFYDSSRRQFENAHISVSTLAAPAQKTNMFRQRYLIVQQRVQRHESFQSSSVKASRERKLNVSAPFNTAREAYKLTPVANLLGRGGSTHLLLGSLSISPSGHLAINDPTGSIILDLQHARPPSVDDGWYTPGMIVVVDGQYEDSESSHTMGLDGSTGVGGFIGGIFVAYGMAAPPSEAREITLGVGGSSTGKNNPVAGFGWVDFLGIGSDRATQGLMSKVESQVMDGLSNELRSRIIILGEVNLDSTKTLQALRRMLAKYAAEPADHTPMAIVLMGNFVRHASMAGQSSEGSIEYKEHFDSLASALSEYPTMLQRTTFVFVPGDRDPWPSSFTAGATAAIPRDPIPDVFTSRIRRAFATANADQERATGKRSTGEAIWTSNPTRLALFGPRLEIALFRDDISGRFRRNTIRFPSQSGLPSQQDVSRQEQNRQGSYSLENERLVQPGSPSVEVESQVADTLPQTKSARQLVKTIINQGHLSPFPLHQRPVMWDFSSSLHLYPLPSALVLMDPEAPTFAIGLDGCHVMNPGPLTPPNRKGIAQWMEYHVGSRRGKPVEIDL